MATTLDLTPLPADAAVRIEVTTTGSSTPTVVLDLDAAEIDAEAASWGGSWTTADVYGDLVAFYSVASAGDATRLLTGLTIGKRYRLDLTVELTAASTQYDVGPYPVGIRPIVPIPTGSGRAVLSAEFLATTATARFRLLTVSNNLPMIERLKLTQLPDGFTFGLVRTDANGTAPVRLEDGQELVGGSLIVTDYEPSLVGPISYTVTTVETVTETTELGVDALWLNVPELPQFNAQPELWLGLTSGRASSSTAHDVIDRPDPIMTMGRLRLRRGELRLWFDDYGAAHALAELYDQGAVSLLRQPYLDRADMYHTLAPGAEIRVDPLDVESTRWGVTIPYVECARPLGPQQGAASWTYGDGLALSPTYSADLVRFPTYADRVAGP
jgi:hypothetical protein